MSPAFFHHEKTDQGDPLVTREKSLPVSGDEWKREGGERYIYIYTRFVFNPGILFYFHYLFISLILTQSLTGNWKLLNLNERELRD